MSKAKKGYFNRLVTRLVRAITRTNDAEYDGIELQTDPKTGRQYYSVSGEEDLIQYVEPRPVQTDPLISDVADVPPELPKQTYLPESERLTSIEGMMESEVVKGDADFATKMRDESNLPEWARGGKNTLANELRTMGNWRDEYRSTIAEGASPMVELKEILHEVAKSPNPTATMERLLEQDAAERVALKSDTVGPKINSPEYVKSSVGMDEQVFASATNEKLDLNPSMADNIGEYFAGSKKYKQLSKFERRLTEALRYPEESFRSDFSKATFKNRGEAVRFHELREQLRSELVEEEILLPQVLDDFVERTEPFSKMKTFNINEYASKPPTPDLFNFDEFMRGIGGVEMQK